MSDLFTTHYHSVCVCICVFIHLSFCLLLAYPSSVCLSACLSVLCLSTWLLPVCLSDLLLNIYLSVWFVDLSVFLVVCIYIGGFLCAKKTYIYLSSIQENAVSLVEDMLRVRLTRWPALSTYLWHLHNWDRRTFLSYDVFSHLTLFDGSWKLDWEFKLHSVHSQYFEAKLWLTLEFDSNPIVRVKSFACYKNWPRANELV